MNVTQTTQGLLRVLFITSIPVIASFAAQADDEGQSGKRRGPPPEAIEACANQSEGEVCSFTGRRGDMTGVCFAPPQKEDAVLACAPEGGPPGHRERENDTEME